jgi:hypothetical protein
MKTCTWCKNDFTEHTYFHGKVCCADCYRMNFGCKYDISDFSLIKVDLIKA